MVACLLAAGVAGCTDDGGDASPVDGAADESSEPLALIGVLLQDPPQEVPAADLYLVELGEPVADGILVDDDSGYAGINVQAIPEHASTTPGDEPQLITLPDGRLLVGTGRPAVDYEYLDEVAALVLDPRTGTVDEVFRHPGEYIEHNASVWDPDRRMLANRFDECFEWSDSTPGSGFTETDCPPVPPPAEAAGELERWDFSCCDPFELRDRESGEVVYSLDGLSQPTMSNPEDIPRFIDQEGDRLLFSVPLDPGGSVPGPWQLLALRGDGEVVELAEGEWNDARIVGDSVVVNRGAPDLSGFDYRLLRYDLATGEPEVLVEGDHIGWTLIPADEPWIMAWQATSRPEEPMVTSIWTGDATVGPLRRVARWDTREVDPYTIELDARSGAVYFSTGRVEHAGNQGRSGTRVWRLERDGVPQEVVASGGSGLVDVLDDGSYLVSTVPEGCSQRQRCGSVLQLLRGEEAIDLVEAPALGPMYFVDDDTIVMGARIELGGAPYQDDIRRIRLDQPDDVEVLYGPSDELPAGARLHVVVGAQQPGDFQPLTSCLGDCPDQRLPQPNDAYICESDPTVPGC